jgi:hypothetical protein
MIESRWKNNFQSVNEILEKCKNNYKELALIAHKQEKKIQFLETKAMHLAMFYIASQLIIFLTNSKPSSYQCRNWWKPFFISMSLAVMFGLNFIATINKYLKTKYAQELNLIDQNENFRHMSHIERNGVDYDDGIESMEVELPHQEKHHTPDMYEVFEWHVHIGATVFTLAAFTGLVLHTCRSSVCADGV